MTSESGNEIRFLAACGSSGQWQGWAGQSWILVQTQPGWYLWIFLKALILLFTGDHFCRCPYLHRCIQHHISGILSQQSKWHLSHGNCGNFEGKWKRLEIQEAYKDYDKVTSDVRGSLVGALRTEFSARQLNHVDPKDLKLYNRFWDLTKNDDFAPEMENSFFVPTNVFITTNQRRGKCSEWDQTRSSCRRDKDCKSTSTRAEKSKSLIWWKRRKGEKRRKRRKRRIWLCN